MKPGPSGAVVGAAPIWSKPEPKSAPGPWMSGTGSVQKSGGYATWPKSNLTFRDITRNLQENEILHEIFHVVPRKIDYLCDSAYL